MFTSRKENRSRTTSSLFTRKGNSTLIVLLKGTRPLVRLAYIYDLTENLRTYAVSGLDSPMKMTEVLVVPFSGHNLSNSTA